MFAKPPENLAVAGAFCGCGRGTGLISDLRFNATICGRSGSTRIPKSWPSLVVMTSRWSCRASALRRTHPATTWIWILGTVLAGRCSRRWSSSPRRAAILNSPTPSSFCWGSRAVGVLGYRCALCAFRGAGLRPSGRVSRYESWPFRPGRHRQRTAVTGRPPCSSIDHGSGPIACLAPSGRMTTSVATTSRALDAIIRGRQPSSSKTLRSVDDRRGRKLVIRTCLSDVRDTWGTPTWDVCGAGLRRLGPPWPTG
mgnify:CR=1 FL=1